MSAENVGAVLTLSDGGWLSVTNDIEAALRKIGLHASGIDFWFQDHVQGPEGSLDCCPVGSATLGEPDYAHAVQEVNMAIKHG